MSGACLLNYLRNLYHVFTLLGVMFFFGLMGLTLSIPMTLLAMSTLLKNIGEAVQSANLDLTQFAMSCAFLIQDEVMAGDITSRLLDPSFYTGILKTALSESADVEAFTEAMELAVKDCVSGVLLAFAVFGLWFLLGIIVGTLLVRFVVRRSIAKRGFLASLATFLLDPLLSVGLIILFFYLYTLFNNIAAAIILLVVYWILVTFLSFFEAWVIHGRKKGMRLKSAFHIKHFLAVFFTFFLIIAVAVGFFAGMVYLTNILTAATLFIPLILLTVSVLTLNAESTVRNEAIRLGLAVDKQITNPIHEIEEIKGEDEGKQEGE